MGDKVVSLVPKGPQPIASNEALADWLESQAQGLRDGAFDDARSVIVVIERKSGPMALVPQSEILMDTARLAGLLFVATQQAADGYLGLFDDEED